MRRGLPIALTGLVLLGLWLRLRHLGQLSLIVDEGVQALAMRGLLDTGRPLLDSGELYLRNPLFLLLQLLSVWTVGLGEWGLRLPSAVFGALGILAGYWLGAVTAGRRVGLLTALFLAVSSWEIELSRYARFYTTFQCFYAVSLTCFYRGFMRGELRYRWLFVGSAAITLLTHELSVMLGLCFLIPLFFPRVSPGRKWLYLGATGLFGIVWSLYRRAMWSFNEAPIFGDPGPVEPTVAQTSWFEQIRSVLPIPGVAFPEFGLWGATAGQQPGLLLAAVILALAGALLFVRRSSGSVQRMRTLVGLAMIGAGLFQQFGLVVVIAAFAVVTVVDRASTLRTPPWLAIYSTTAALLAFWSWVAITKLSLAPREAVLELFGYPNFLQYFAYWYVQGWPLLTAVCLLGGIVLAGRVLHDRHDPAPLFLLGALVVPVVVTSFFRAFQEARYTFHLYPLMLIVFSSVCIRVIYWVRERVAGKHRWMRSVAVGVIVLGILFTGRDSNPIAAWSIGERDYRSAKDPIRSVINWSFYANYHQDRKSPSEFVRERRSAGDRVVALGPPHMVAVYHHYSGGVDAMLGRWEDYLYYRRQADGRTVGYITGCEVLQDGSLLRSYIDDPDHAGGAVWLLGDRKLLADDNPYYPTDIRRRLMTWSNNPDHLGEDGQTFAVRLRREDG